MKITVNGKTLDAKPGMSVIDAIFAVGDDVPYFCSQEYMSPIGACRMCLAKVGAPRKDRATGEWIIDEDTGEAKIFWFPNPMATCTTQVMEGMVVDSVSKGVKDAQNGMVEFTLINHPLDCPTCDKGGACELQDRAYEYGTGRSRFQFDKRHQEKHHALSELITLDRERCIHCKRCVRYFEEVPGDEVLDFIERGGHTYIGTLEDGLPSPFTGNITDICPVGALLDSTSRFRGRNWEYDHTDTTTLNDPSGAALRVDARTGRIERIKSGLNPDVNKTWIDDGTRFGHEYVDAEDRVTLPHVRRDGVLQPTTWADAMQFVASKLEGVGEHESAVLLRGDATLEEGVAAKALAAHLNTGRLDVAPRTAASVLPSGPAATLTDVATSDGLLILGDPTEEAPTVDLRIKDALKGVDPPELLPHGVPIADLRLRERMPRDHARLSVLAPYRTDLMKHAGRPHVYAAGQEAGLLKALSARAQGQAADADVAAMLDGTHVNAEQADAILAQLKSADKPVIVWSSFVANDLDADAAARQLAQALGARTLILGPVANAQGLERLGVAPSHDRYDRSRTLQAAREGGLKALIISQLDPAAHEPTAQALENLDLLVVHTSFMTATAERADVVLPARTPLDKDGLTISAEGRLLPVNAAPVEAGAALDFTGLVKAYGEAAGTRLDGRSLKNARRALSGQLGLDFDVADLPQTGRLLPAPAGGRAKAVAREATPQAAGPALVTPSLLRTEYLSRNPKLQKEHGGETLTLHPTTAAAHNLTSGDRVALTVGGVRRELTVKVSEGTPEGMLRLPALPDQPIGRYDADLTQAERLASASAVEVA